MIKMIMMMVIFYPMLSVVVGTPSSWDVAGFKALGGWRWQEGLSNLCHIFRYQKSVEEIY